MPKVRLKIHWTLNESEQAVITSCKVQVKEGQLKRLAVPGYRCFMEYRTRRGSLICLRAEHRPSYYHFGCVRIIAELDGLQLGFKDFWPSTKYQQKKNSLLALEFDTEPFFQLGESFDTFRNALRNTPIHMTYQGEFKEKEKFEVGESSEKKEPTDS